MPLYEYQCEVCGNTTTALIFNAEEEESVRCHECRSCQLTRILSRCTTYKTEAQRLTEFDTRTERDETFYKDDRNVGLWAQKRVKELGMDLGSDFSEKLEQARSGKIPGMDE